MRRPRSGRNSREHVSGRDRASDGEALTEIDQGESRSFVSEHAT